MSKTDVDGRLGQRPLTQATPLASQDDAQLARVARDEPAAFEELYRRYVDQVYRYLLVRLGNVEDAQDLTAQTFLGALEALGGYRSGLFVAWLFSIARRRAADHFRRRRPTVSLDEAAELPYDRASPEELALGRLQLERVVRALQALPPERAEALALRFFGGLSAAEIGAVMGKQEAAVNMLVHRAVRDLSARVASTQEVER